MSIEPNYTTRRCAHCGGGIEFDANQIDDDESLLVDCPHCQKPTELGKVDVNEKGRNLPENPVSFQVNPISVPELVSIGKKFAEELNLEIDVDALEMIAQSSVGTPVDLLDRLLYVKDFLHSRRPAAKISTEATVEALKELSVLRIRLKPLTTLDSSVIQRSSFVFVGQERIKARIELAVEAAKRRHETAPHMLFVGPPGCGKTALAITISGIIAKNLLAEIKAADARAIEKPSDLAGILTNLEEGDVLVIDNIDLLQKSISDYLRLAMNEFKLDIVLDEGDAASRVRLNLPRFTLIATATRKERISRVIGSFQILEALDDYSSEELREMVSEFGNRLELEIDKTAVELIARSGDNDPKVLMAHLRHIRDFAHVKASSQKITEEIAKDALNLLGVLASGIGKGSVRAAIPTDVRREVWRRDSGKCAKCGSRENLEYDHIIPISKGGSNTVRNIELLCEDCNREKSATIQ